MLLLDIKRLQNMTLVNSYLLILNLIVNVRSINSLKNKVNIFSNLFMQPRHFVLTKIMQ
jgi:hypothetical protein